MTQFLAPVLHDAEEDVERSLRPHDLGDFVGQERVKEQLSIALEAARGRGEALDHVLLAGPPGLGKTSLAQIVRNELGVGIRQVAGPGLERKDIAAILTSLEPRDVLFVDEIHRMSRAAEEILYPALEDYRLDLVVGPGPGSRTRWSARRSCGAPRGSSLWRSPTTQPSSSRRARAARPESRTASCAACAT